MANTGNITQADLQTRFNAAGVYFVERDDSQGPAVVSTGPMRLIFGSSRIGPFNRPVYIEQGDTAAAIRLFGPIDKTLERRGSFFHRSLAVALEQGPVMAMCLMALNNEVDPVTWQPTNTADTGGYASFSCDPLTANPTPKRRLLSSFFNKERFWQAAAPYLLATRAVADQGKLLNLANLSQSPVTFVVRKSTVQGYSVTTKDWYTQLNKEMPSWVRPGDLVSDYFVDVVALVGDYSANRFVQLSQDPIMSKYFDQKGLKTALFEQFLARPEVSVKAIYTGCVIPNFRDSSNRSQYLEDVVNQRVTQTGILCAIDRAAIDKLAQGVGTDLFDLVGHRLLKAGESGVTDSSFLSYNAALSESLNFGSVPVATVTTVPYQNSGVTLSGISLSSRPGAITVTVDAAFAGFSTLTNILQVGALIKGATTSAGTTAGVPVAAPVLRVSRLYTTPSQIVFDVTSAFKDSETLNTGSFVDLAANNLLIMPEANSFLREPGNSFYIADASSEIYLRYLAGSVQDGDVIQTATRTFYLKFEKTVDVYRPTPDYRPILKIDLYTDSDLTIPAAAGSAPAMGTTKDSAGITVTSGICVISQGDGLRYLAPVSTMIGSKVVRLAIAEESNIKLGQYLQGVDGDGNYLLTRILSIRRVTIAGQPTPTQIEVTTAEDIRVLTTAGGAQRVERYLPIEQYFTHLNPTYVEGFVLKDKHLPDGTEQRRKSICAVMTTGTLFESLVDPEMISFRYLVDTYSGGLETQSKRDLARLVKTRQRAMGLLNAPSVEEFRASANPRFTTTPTPVDPLPVLDTAYILAGGNTSENPEFLYTMPEEADGASQVGYFFPYLEIQDEGGDVTSVVPAAYVSNNFMQKYKSGNPYLPTAGSRRGAISADGLLGTDYQLTRTDRGNLEKKGINPLWGKADGRVLIYGDETGYKTFNSALNNLSARDTLISIEIDQAAILENYVFEYNDDSTRSEIVSLMTNYLSGLRDGYGAITSYSIIFDRSNNPDFVIKENAAILDIVVELPAIAKKYVSRLTIRKGSQPTVGSYVTVI